MKLTAASVERTLTQLDAKAIPETHPVVPQLNRMFGEHTFFLDDAGLSIVEPTDTEAGAPAAQVVKLARWDDDAHSRLAPHEPELTSVVVLL